jgi:hypothetical protein
MDIGAFFAKETVLYCPMATEPSDPNSFETSYPKAALLGLMSWLRWGLRFLSIAATIRSHGRVGVKNVFISEREISYLGRKFIIYLALAHRQSRTDSARVSHEGRGGYILHVDGTCEGDSPNLFCGLDGLSELVLDTVKISSEKKDKLVPFFRGIKEQYGEPRALVHDMGKGIVNAVEEVFPGIPDFICHFHFLRDIGKDLLADEYTAFQKRLRRLKVRPTLRRQAKYLEKKSIRPVTISTESLKAFKVGTWQANHLTISP